MGFFDFLKRKKKGGVTFEGGPGDTLERAVLIRGAASHNLGIQAEYQYLAEKFGQPGMDWLLETQALMERHNRYYDEMRVKLSDGTEQVVFFDITEFFGKR